MQERLQVGEHLFRMKEVEAHPGLVEASCGRRRHSDASEFVVRGGQRHPNIALPRRKDGVEMMQRRRKALVVASNVAAHVQMAARPQLLEKSIRREPQE